MKCCLSIAGSDSSGGAGIQADLKTFAAHGVYGMTAITALTAQNTLGVHATSEIPPEFVAKQIDVVFTDIRPDAVKIGMLSNTEIVNQVADQLSQHQANNVVFDPVMISTSGQTLLQSSAIRAAIDRLVPLTDIITPNVPELIALCEAQNIVIDKTAEIGREEFESISQMLFASLPFNKAGKKVAVLSKGGHLNNEKATDLLITEAESTWINGDRVLNENTHGTGCTLSAAICAQLARGHDLKSACKNAKLYLYGALSKQLDLGKGKGPVSH